jgi:signal transduction histidine kinase/CheY-like chemotaxis protein/HPt (histidine-containing phosphotransfer) domain-containing protein
MANRRSWIYAVTTTTLFALPLTVMLLTGIFFIVERSRKDLEQTASQTGKLLGAFIRENVNQLEILASDRAVSDPENPIAARLNATLPYANVSGIRDIFIADGSGIGIGLDGTRRDFSHDRAFIQTKRGSSGISYEGPGDGGSRRFFAISVPLYSHNAYSGTIVQFVPWENVTTLINTINFDRNGYAFIGERVETFSSTPRLNINDAIVRDSEKALKKDPFGRIADIQRRFAAGEIGSGVFRAYGNTRLIGFAPIPGTSWSIGITTPLSEVLDHAWIMVLFYAGLIALMLFFTERYYRRRFLLQEEKDNAIMRLQAANEKLESQSDIISAMAERRISESEGQYLELFETMSSGAILQEMILDGDGSPANFRYLSVNGMAERMFHIDRKNFVGKTYRDVNADASDEMIATMNEIAFGSEPRRLPDFETSDGLVIRNTAYSPKPGQFVTLYDDITEEVRAKEALEVEREKLIKATRLAEEANRAKSNFLASMSHEIRTPLNAIIGLADVEIETHEEPLTVRTFTAIRESAKNLMTLLNDILDYSKMEAGKLSLERKPFALEDTVNNALVVTTPRLSGKRVNMLVDYDATLPEFIMGDSVRLWQILKNLLDNAGKFTTEGQILLKVQNLSGKSIRFTVSDTGCGIEPSQAKRLFEAFEQGDSELARRAGGTGLGLSITKQLVEMMNGTIEVSSEVGQGTTFTVTLPLEVPAAEREANRLPEEAALLAGKRILVADDDPNARHILKAILEKAGTTTVCVPNGEEAIACATRDEEEDATFDLIILDLLLPGLSGIDTANELAQVLHYRPLLILVTAWSKNFSVDEIQSAGFAETIDKPFMPSTVIRKIVHAFGEKAPRDSTRTTEPREQYPDARILAVEDNAQNRDVVNRMLFLFGIRPEFAVNGIEAIEKTKSKAYDLILMDIQMPDMNGLEATRLIRAREKSDGLAPTPIVAMTAYAMAEDIKASLAVGMDAHITKPIEIGMLKNTLEKYVGSKKAASVAPEAREDQPNEDGAESMPQLDCVNVPEGLARLGNDASLFIRLLLGLKDMLERPQPEFESAISGDMINATARFIHTVKGIAGNLGVTELYRITGELESDMRAHKPQKAKYDEYRKICARIFTELDKKLARKVARQERKAPLEAGTDEELAAILEKIVVPLETGDASAVEEILVALKAKKFRKLGRKGVDELVKLAAVFDYDAMLERISAIS